MVDILNVNAELFEALLHEDLGSRYGLSRQQVDELIRFRDDLRRFEDRVRGGCDGDDLRTTSDNDWPNIVILAEQTSRLLVEWRTANCDCGGLSILNFDLPE